MADVSERRVRPIQEAILSKNWKQALQLCEKWQKKGEKSDRFQAIRAYVLAKQQDANSTKRGRDEIVQLCNRDPALKDLDAIYQIQAALNDLGIEDDVGRKLWERAAAGSPDNKDIAMTWLDEAIDRGDWQSAQKATMALRKASPKDRNYEFWTTLMCFMIHEDQSLSDKERNMFGTLAYRMLAKAAAAVPQDPQELLSSGKAIQSPEELSLLVRVYLKTGHIGEAKALLIDSNGLGPRSALFKLDRDLHRSLQLEVLQAAEDWPGLLNELRIAAKEPSPKQIQISSILGILFEAIERKSHHDLLREMRECLEGGLEVLPDCRDVHSGMLRILRLERANNFCTSDDLVRSCKQFFLKWCEQLPCFDELRAPLEMLDEPSQQDFIDFVRKTADKGSASRSLAIVTALNALKLEYCFLASRTTATVVMQDFSRQVIGLYRQFSATRKEGGDQIAQMVILACMALLRPSQTDDESDWDLENVSRLQAAFLLRYCLTRSGDNYPALVVLTRVASLLGAISLSATFFKKLSIKNLQWENAGHLLLTRLSTLHPQRSRGGEGAFYPLQTLDLAMAANADSVRCVRKLIMVGLSSKSYVNVMETISLREDLKRSVSKELYLIESARTKRLWGGSSSEREALSSGPFVDRRDFGFIPSFEHVSVKPFAQYLEAGPRPKEGWLRIMKICNGISDLVYREYHEPQSLNKSDVEEIASVLEELRRLLLTADDELTKTEVQNCNLRFHLGKATTVRLQQGPSSASAVEANHDADFDNSVQGIQDWLNEAAKERKQDLLDETISMSGTPIAPSWRYLHSAFSTLESLQSIALFLAAGQTKASASAPASKSRSKAKNTALALRPGQGEKMQEVVDQIEKAVHDSASRLKANLNGPGVLDQMMDGVFGRSGVGEVVGKEMEKLADAETVAEQFCGEVRDSWEDALDGVLAVKVKKSKGDVHVH